MALLLNCGAVFLHVPKTGGSWVTDVLNECDLIERNIGPKHWDMTRVMNEPRFKRARKFVAHQIWGRLDRVLGHSAPPEPFRFCFVRHPLKWYESWWKYMSGRGWNDWGVEGDKDNWHPNAILNGLGDDDFNAFVRKVVAKRPGYVTELYGWYTQPGISFIGKQERLTDDLIDVLKQLNVNFDEQRIREFRPINESQRPSTPVVWDEALKAEVERLEYAGLVRYGYLPLKV